MGNSSQTTIKFLSFMSEFIIYPCSKSGKILKGFCLTKCVSLSCAINTLDAWSKNCKKFGINYWFNGLDGCVYSLNKDYLSILEYSYGSKSL